MYESEGDTWRERACAIYNWVEQQGAKVSLSSRLLYPHSRQLVHRMDFTTALKATAARCFGNGSVISHRLNMNFAASHMNLDVLSDEKIQYSF